MTRRRESWVAPLNQPGFPFDDPVDQLPHDVVHEPWDGINYKHGEHPKAYLSPETVAINIAGIDAVRQIIRETRKASNDR